MRFQAFPLYAVFRVYANVSLDTDFDACKICVRNAEYNTPEWKDKVLEIYQSGNGSIFDVFLFDPGLFLKNYSDTLFNNVPDKLFNFNTWPSLSIIPIFQYVGFIPILGGLLYLQKIKLNEVSLF